MRRRRPARRRTIHEQLGSRNRQLLAAGIAAARDRAQPPHAIRISASGRFLRGACTSRTHDRCSIACNRHASRRDKRCERGCNFRSSCILLMRHNSPRNRQRTGPECRAHKFRDTCSPKMPRTRPTSACTRHRKPCTCPCPRSLASRDSRHHSLQRRHHRRACMSRTTCSPSSSDNQRWTPTRIYHPSRCTFPFGRKPNARRIGWTWAQPVLC